MDAREWEANRSPGRVFVLLLGALWLTDGALQLQPKLFGHELIDTVVAPNRQGQPAFMAHIITFGMHVSERNLIVANAAAAGVELLIGAVLLAPVGCGWRRFALWVSIAWAALVWVFGEGAGNLLTGSASFFTGAPGAAVLYSLLAVVLLFPRAFPFDRLPAVTGVVFLLGAGLNAMPTFWRAESPSMLWDASAADSRGFIAFPGQKLAEAAPSAAATNLIVIAALLFLGALLLVKPSRPLGTATLIVLTAVWWISQDFGGVLTFPHDVATDPSSAPLLMVMVLPLVIAARGTVRQSSNVTTPSNLAIDPWNMVGSIDGRSAASER